MGDLSMYLYCEASSSVESNNLISCWPRHRRHSPAIPDISLPELTMFEVDRLVARLSQESTEEKHVQRAPILHTFKLPPSSGLHHRAGFLAFVRIFGILGIKINFQRNLICLIHELNEINASGHLTLCAVVYCICKMQLL